LANCVKSVEAADDTIVDKLIALGVISVLDVEDVGTEPLISELDIEADVAEQLVAAATEQAERLAAEAEKNQAQDVLEQEAETADNEQ